MRTHVDGAEGPCSRGARCTGGEHTQGEDCESQDCAYCLTLRCPHELIEHDTGVLECRELGAACPGTWCDDGIVDCSELGEHVCPPAPARTGTPVTWSLPPAQLR